MELLIVEDQKWPLRALETAVSKILPSARYDIARCYVDAESQIRQNQYDMILLDHRMPHEDQGDLETRDRNAFSDILEEIGYGLIPMIRERNPDTRIVGTSSLSHLGNAPQPDYVISKLDAVSDLGKVVDSQ